MEINANLLSESALEQDFAVLMLMLIQQALTLNFPFPIFQSHFGHFILSSVSYHLVYSYLWYVKQTEP